MGRGHTLQTVQHSNKSQGVIQQPEPKIRAKSQHWDGQPVNQGVLARLTALTGQRTGD